MLAVHILSFGFVLGVTAVADKEVFGWVSGKREKLERKSIMLYHTLIWAGLLSLIATGLYMFWPMRLYLLGTILFDIKLIFVAILLVNAFLLGRLMPAAFTGPFRELSAHTKKALLMSGAVSAFSWFCAAALAFLIF